MTRVHFFRNHVVVFMFMLAHFNEQKKLLDIRKREGERNNIDVIFDFLNIDSAKIIYHSEHLV